MKTPKRDCDWCNSWELEHCGRSWCGDCERGKRMFAQSARWIRKNREARLRHAIRQEKRRLKNEEFRHRIYFQSTLDNMLQARTILFVNPLSGTYGQDVEGS